MTTFRLLYQDEHLVAIDKPAGFHVHPPEDQRHTISKASNCLALLRDQLDRYLYPVHRLDRPTSGVLVFALSSEVAAKMGTLFVHKKIGKRYIALVRGWMKDHLEIDNASGHTRFTCLYRKELPFSIGPYSRSRYSLIEAIPLSGKNHQIRRHLKSMSHPIIGDRMRGDGQHNSYFATELQAPGLFLKAHRLSFEHPITGKTIALQSRWEHRWHQLFEIIGACGY